MASARGRLIPCGSTGRRSDRNDANTNILGARHRRGRHVHGYRRTRRRRRDRGGQGAVDPRSVRWRHVRHHESRRTPRRRRGRISGRDTAHRARHDGRHQRVARVQGRQGGARHHRGLPRRDRVPAVLQGKRLQSAARAAPCDRSPAPAQGRARASRPPRRGPDAARRGGLPRRARRTSGRVGRSGRRLPAVQFRQSGARGTHRRPDRRGAARRLRLPLEPGPARNPGVRTGLDDRRQRLRRSADPALSRSTGGAPARPGVFPASSSSCSRTAPSSLPARRAGSR